MQSMSQRNSTHRRTASPESYGCIGSNSNYWGFSLTFIITCYILNLTHRLCLQYNSQHLRAKLNSINYIIIYTFWDQDTMAEQDFQIIINNEDYSKLKLHEQENKKLQENNKQLKQQIEVLKIKVKDLTRSVYVRDSFIDYVINQSDYAFGPILNMEIISSDITQSFYQDVVSHQQNGISSIQLRDALDVYINKNKRFFERLSQVQDKFVELNKKIKQLQNKKQGQSKLAQNYQRPSIFHGNENLEKQTLKQQIQLEHIKCEIKKFTGQKQKLLRQYEKQKLRNNQLTKQNEKLSKKVETKQQKSYVIKLLVDQYYNQLEQNLQKIGGLSMDQIGIVVSNQMKGIIQYINNLAKKAKS